MKFSIHFTCGLGLMATLAACGGGGGGGPTPPPTVAVAGVAVDGYLNNALAFLDLNGNEQLDAGEPSARTNARGEFTLNATAEQKATASVVVQAIAGETIDMDQPNTALTAGMTLIAPAGKPEVVSPLSTWVAGTMRRENKTLEQAKASVAAELGLNAEDLLQDFVAQSPNGSPSDAYKVAVSLAEVLKSAPANADKDARFDHVSNNLRSVTDNLTAIKGATLSDIRALVKEDIALNTLTLAFNDKWQTFLRTATSLQVISERRFGTAHDLVADPDTLTIEHPANNQIKLKLGSLYSRTITFAESALQEIATTLLLSTETVDLRSLAPQMAVNVSAGQSATLFSKVSSTKSGNTCAKSTGSYAVFADTATSLTIKLTIEESDLNASAPCSKISATKEVYSFKLTANSLSLQELTVYMGESETLKLGF